MKLIKPSVEILSIFEGDKALNLIEHAGRTCYKSEDKITEDSNKAFVQKINKMGHTSVLEHSAVTVRFICDRGISHEIVRHRLCSLSQESTRFCNYKGGVTFIIPPWVDIEPGDYNFAFPSTGQHVTRPNWVWYRAMLSAEQSYKDLLVKGWSPQQGRSVLPNSLKTEIVMTCNFREMLHILELRCSKAAHPQIREVMIPLLKDLHVEIPVLLDELYERYIG